MHHDARLVVRDALGWLGPASLRGKPQHKAFLAKRNILHIVEDSHPAAAAELPLRAQVCRGRIHNDCSAVLLVLHASASLLSWMASRLRRVHLGDHLTAFARWQMRRRIQRPPSRRLASQTASNRF